MLLKWKGIFLLCSWQLNNDVNKSLAGLLPHPTAFQRAFFSNGKITIGQITNFWPRIVSHTDKTHCPITPVWHWKIFCFILKSMPGTHRAEVRNIVCDIWHDWHEDISAPLMGPGPVMLSAMSTEQYNYICLKIFQSEKKFAAQSTA